MKTTHSIPHTLAGMVSVILVNPLTIVIGGLAIANIIFHLFGWENPNIID